jgi:tRNA 2-thiocytidine biosynthesis protein TtcA
MAEARQEAAFPPRSEGARVRRRLYRKMLKATREHDLVGPGDRVMVCVSGGKDSYTLLDLLWEARSRSPFDFEVIAVHLDQQQPGYDGRPLADWLERFGAPYELLSKDTYSIVLELTGGTSTFCAPCSRLRRGILYDTAERLGCNKIALGHHRDDSLETFLLNMLYAGKIQAMPATYTTNDGRFDVIRPLIECAEDDIRTHASLRGYPILPCNLCGSQDDLKRDAMTRLLDTLEGDIPDVRNVMFAALKNVIPTHLLDRDVLDKWAAGGGVRVEPEASSGCGAAPPTPDSADALPVLN